MNAISLLKKDHRSVKELLEELESTRGASQRRKDLFAKVQKEMQLHELIEEEIFYPELRKHPKAKDIVLEGLEEHHVVDILLDELDDMAFDDERWEAKLKVAKENIEHHIEEEEEELFPMVREKWSAQRLNQIGEQMQAMMKERGAKKAA